MSLSNACSRGLVGFDDTSVSCASSVGIYAANFAALVANLFSRKAELKDQYSMKCKKKKTLLHNLNCWNMRRHDPLKKSFPKWAAHRGPVDRTDTEAIRAVATAW